MQIIEFTIIHSSGTGPSLDQPPHQEYHDYTMPESWKIDPGEILNNRYTVKKLIAEGGIGKTFLAVDSSSNKEVALKAALLNE